MSIENWISFNKLNAEVLNNICSIDDKKFLVLNREDDELLFDKDFDVLLSDEEIRILSADDSIKILFEFGDNWYYSEPEKINLKLFKYLGKELTDFDLPFPYLGIHGEYDICSGSRTYKEWCVKAKFLNSPSLAICETNTLAGTLSFQMSCKNANIKSILGETVTVAGQFIEGQMPGNEYRYNVKLYVKDYEGWINLLNINSKIKVFNDGFVNEEFLLERCNGLICVLTGNLIAHTAVVDRYKKAFGDDLYYQLDFVEWDSQDKEKDYLETLSVYLKSHIDYIKPVLICDSFYLDKDHGYIKKILNTIGKVGFQNQSKDQYFKPLQDIYSQIQELSPSEDWMDKPFFTALENTLELSDKCNFEIKLGELHLPDYEMTQIEKDSFDSNEDLFFAMVDSGLERIKDKLVKPKEEYLERIDVEIEVIKSGDLIDYFLILADIIKWSEENDILTGVGRGSAAGSLIAYLLNITQIDPLQYGLLFYRFLNPGRIGKSLPDIDTDFASDRRDDVKRYMENRYGVNYVTSIGTYGTFKVKSGISDLCRYYNIDLKQTKYITSLIDNFLNAENNQDLTLTNLFKAASETSSIKKFIQDYPHVIESLQLISGQVKTSSIHAAGVIIVPKKYHGRDMTVYDWMPVKKIGDVLVTEWEGPVLEDAGFLKEDILGTKQLQKLHEILVAIKNNHGTSVNLIDIAFNPNDRNVFELFKGGNNEDVFQFGATGLQNYCRELQPEVIDDLIATQALYRPGPMESGIHKKYIQVKNGLKPKEVDYMMEEITNETYGFVVYQEQVMNAMVVLGGFDSVEADNIRKAMGKKDMEKMAKYKPLFIEGAIKNKCDQYEALSIWNKYEAFAKYAFNKSHAAAYTITGYQCQWLKFYYPLEFWSVALNFSDQEEIARRIAEMHRISEVKVLPPDINKSTNVFESDVENNVIYWSIGSIKYIGPAALEVIIKERTEKGKFFSFDDFINRIEKSKVNKRCITNLILSGCFDIVEKIKKPSERINLLNKFLNNVLPEGFSDTSVNWKDYFWVLKQKELTGFGYLEFDKIYHSNILPKLSNPSKLRYVDGLSFQDDSAVGDNKAVIGVLNEIVERKMRTKIGSFGELTLNFNDENIVCLMWSEQWEKYKEVINNSKNKIVCVTGKVVYDDKYKKLNILQTSDKTQIEVL